MFGPQVEREIGRAEEVARMCRTEEGRAEVKELTGVAVDGSRLFAKHDLNRLLAQVLQREGL